MVAQEFYSIIPTIVEQAMCVLLCFLVMTNIKENRKLMFFIAFMISNTWVVLKIWLETSAVYEGTGWMNAYKSIGALCVIALYGSAIEGGIVLSAYLVLFQDIGMLSVIMLITFVQSIITGRSFSELANSSYTLTIPFLIIHFILYTLLLLLLKRIIRSFSLSSLERNPVMKAIVFIVLLIVMILTFTWMFVPGSGEWNTEYILLYICLELSFFLFVFYYIHTTNKDQQIIMLRRQNQLMKEHLEVYREQVSLARKLRHDILRHLQVLAWDKDTDSNNKRSERYVHELQEMYDRLQTGFYSGNPDMDAILFSLEKYCRNNNIPCRISLRELGNDALPDDASLPVAFYLVYWVIQCCETMTRRGNVSVEIAGGKIAGICRIKSELTGEDVAELKNGFAKTGSACHVLSKQLENDICRRIQDSLKGRGDVRICQKRNSLSMSIETRMK